MERSHATDHLAKRAQVEVFIQIVRVLSALVRNNKQECVKSFLTALKNGNGEIQRWEIDLEGMRGKRLFKKSMAIIKNLIGDLPISDILNEDEISHLESFDKRSV